METGPLFIVLGLLFFSLLVYVGVRARKRVHDASDYLLAGRQISSLLNLFGVASIGFAGTSITLVPGMAVLYGFWPSFANQLIFSIGGLVLYGIWFTPFIRRCGAQTLPEWLELRFNGQVRTVVTFGTIIGLTGIMANNVVSIAAVISGFIELPLPATVSIIFFVFLLFSYIGGFWAVTFTDFIQLALGAAAVPLILFSLGSYFGGLTWVTEQWPEGWTSGAAGSLPVMSLTFPSVVTSVFLFASFLVWGNNYYWLRSASCRTEQAARNSFILAGILLSVLIYLPLLLVGTYSRAAFPELLSDAGFLEASAAYGIFLRRVPLLISSVLLLVPLAAGISTATTAHIGAASVAVRDLYQRKFKPEATSKQLLIPSKVILLILGLMVWALCFYPGGPMILFAFANAWLGPPALLMVLGLYWRRFTAAAALWSTVLSIALMTVLTAADLLGLFHVDAYMHVGMAGFFTGLISALVLTPFSKPAYYGTREWERTPAAGNRSNPALTDTAVEILRYISFGYHTMAEICDLTGLDAAQAHGGIALLDRGGYIERDSLTGRGFYTFQTSRTGYSLLRQYGLQGKPLPGADLEAESRQVLKAADQGPDALNRMIESGMCSSLKQSALLAKLIRDGKIIEQGIWYRKLSLSKQGKDRQT